MNRKEIVINSDLLKKFKNCPKCHKKTDIDVNSKGIFINCDCGIKIVIDNKGYILKYIFEENGNTYCKLCGSKVEGGYCNCFVK